MGHGKSNQSNIVIKSHNLTSIQERKTGTSPKNRLFQPEKKTSDETTLLAPRAIGTWGSEQQSGLPTGPTTGPELLLCHSNGSQQTGSAKYGASLKKTSASAIFKIGTFKNVETQK